MGDEYICGINRFYERDIDMLMAEELRVSAEFGAWVMGRFGISAEFVFPAVSSNVSVVEDGSEADVVATFRTKTGLHHRLFVENKISAVLMPEQLERYVRRAEGEMRRELIAGFSVLLFAPSRYPRRALPERVARIDFEEAAVALSCRGDLRSQYKASLLMKALPLLTSAARDAQVVVTEPYVKDWWDAVYAMLEHEFGGYFVHKTRYPRSVYFAPETLGQASYLRVDFKGHKGEVDLAFRGVSAAALSAALSLMENPPGRVISNGKSSSIRIDGLDPFVISDGLIVIETRVRRAYQAAQDLLNFWNSNRTSFDALVS
jgi:hypothetical protein